MTYQHSQGEVFECSHGASWGMWTRQAPRVNWVLALNGPQNIEPGYNETTGGAEGGQSPDLFFFLKLTPFLVIENICQ